ncbi:MAG: matrixin family metalloprotease, partial [Acetobacteraceae bacterium]
AYAFAGPTWASNTITWSFAAFNFLADGATPFSHLIDDPTAASLVRSAFAAWQGVADIHFIEVADSANYAALANIRIGFGNLNPAMTQQIGLTSFYQMNNHFNNDVIVRIEDPSYVNLYFNASGALLYAGYDTSFYQVALHEIGHALGLDHSTEPTATMYPVLGAANRGLTASDIAGVTTLYGAAINPLHAVYRFFDAGRTGEHFYTTDAAEKAFIINNLPSYRYEGAQWATPDKSAGTVDVHRFLDTIRHTHLFTSDVAERDSILQTLPGLVYEGVAFQAYAKDSTAAGQLSLERFYDPTRGDHHLALTAEAAGIRHGAAGPNWVDEGPGLTVHVIDNSVLIA